MISKTTNFEHISKHRDKKCTFVLVKGKIDGIEVNLLNVYVPPGNNCDFYRFIFELMITSWQGLLLCNMQW